jgi:hypothetical protein
MLDGYSGLSSCLDVAKRTLDTSFAHAAALTEIATKPQLESLTLLGRHSRPRHCRCRRPRNRR